MVPPALVWPPLNPTDYPPGSSVLLFGEQDLFSEASSPPLLPTPSSRLRAVQPSPLHQMAGHLLEGPPAAWLGHILRVGE